MPEKHVDSNMMMDGQVTLPSDLDKNLLNKIELSQVFVSLSQQVQQVSQSTFTKYSISGTAVSLLATVQSK